MSGCERPEIPRGGSRVYAKAPGAPLQSRRRMMEGQVARAVPGPLYVRPRRRVAFLGSTSPASPPTDTVRKTVPGVTYAPADGKILLQLRRVAFAGAICGGCGAPLHRRARNSVTGAEPPLERRPRCRIAVRRARFPGHSRPSHLSR